MDFNRVIRSVEPTKLPVTTDEVKAHLRIVSDDEDDYLNSLIQAATAMIDGPHGIGVALMPQTYEMSLSKLWAGFTIPVYPVRTVDLIEWEDADGNVQSSTDFRYNKRTNPCHVYHDLRGNARQDSVVVTFTAGFTNLPADLRHAVLMIVGHFYANAEATSEKKLETVPMAVETILARYRAA
ncbi:hypothetical protein AV944_06680 [Sphingomonas sp. LK11]|jgi:uncharacterized phiE125 gp8 family phage protein|uniref:head-tail connector protein n=1 Tax=Sphingomonas sp. LK11 TaxID=1390395 RepID=UPI000972A550|nr:head-tail connector protein [Sphingomonas sp. LK11]APX65581.1 hypothetical protein AV944_06680 [Sphingomonas sp. LK11]